MWTGPADSCRQQLHRRGLPKKKELLGADSAIAPDLAHYEVANSILKHQTLLRDIKGGLPYLGLFMELVDSGAPKGKRK